MPTISFYGTSDDLVQIEGDAPGTDEYNIADEPTGFLLTAGAERMMVVAYFSVEGVWTFAPAMAEEDVPFPAWPLRIATQSGYSMLLEIDAPDGVTVSQIAD